MSNCGSCGLPTEKERRMHDDTKICMAKLKEAVQKLARYRLLEGDEEKMSDCLRQETLELAMKIHKDEVKNSVTDKAKEPDASYPQYDG